MDLDKTLAKESIVDSCQLHESPTNCGKFKLKMGLLIKFIREVV